MYGFLTVPCFRLRRLVASTSLTRSHRNGPRWRAGFRKYVARVGTNRRAAYGSLAADIVEPIEVRIGQERDAGETLRSGYGARSLRAFGEIAYRFDLGPAAFEPFVNLANVDLRNDASAETEGGAALWRAARPALLTDGRASRLAMNGRIPLRHRAAHRRASHQHHRR